METERRGSTVEEAFKEACNSVWEHRNSDEYAAVRMQLYGLYKVAKEGRCKDPKPDTVLGGEKARMKWDAWMLASTFSTEEAMARYVSVALAVVKSREGVVNAAAAASAVSALKIGDDENIPSPAAGEDAEEERSFSGGGAGGIGEGDAKAEDKCRLEGEDKGGEGGGGRRGGDGDEGGVRRRGSRMSANEASKQSEIDRLKQHTQSLERYLDRIRDELSLATDGLEDVERTMSGWLYRWRDRDVYLWGSPKWERRFFTLVGETLTMFKSDHKAEVESVMSLKRCVLRDEGTKKGKSPGRGKPTPRYHVFGLYMEGTLERGPDSGVLLRLSTDSREDADRWMSALNEACFSDGEDDEDIEDDDEAYMDDDQDEKLEGEDKAGDDGTPQDAASAEVRTRELFARDFDGGSSRRMEMLRKGSWDTSGGLNNFEQLKSLSRLSRHLSLDRLEHEASAKAETKAEEKAKGKFRSKTKGDEKAKEGEREESHKPKKKRKFDATGYPASRPMHKESTVSLLSGEAPTQNYRGLLNLMAILLLVTNSRLIAENVRRYGVLVSLPKLTEPSDLLDAPRVAGTLLWGFHVAFALVVEKLAMPRPGNDEGMLGGTEGPVLVLHVTNLTLLLSIAMGIAWSSQGSPVFGFAYLFTALILWLKLISYAHVNRDLRLAWRELARAAKDKEKGEDGGRLLSRESTADGPSGGGKKEQQQHHDRRTSNYPSNVGVVDLVYFWFAPTLCYQTDYPRSGKRRYKYIVSLMVRLVIVLGAMSVIADQYILPTVHEFYGSTPSDDGLLISLEHLLTLAVPNTYFWLLGFYGFFHLMLNLLAEILRFGDRMFYGDWWNANTLEAYWRLWNMPVHYWIVRHFYFPCLRAGVSKMMASMLCFLLSAVLHEVVVSVPFHMVKFYAFLGMLGNVPLIPLTKMLSKILGDDQQLGNWIFWVLFCVVGQPMSLLCYYRDYCSEHECSNPLLG